MTTLSAMPAHRITPARIVGWALLALSALPLHRLLAPERTGSAGISTRASAEAAWNSGWLGSLIVIVLAAIISRATPTDRLKTATNAAVSALAAVPGRNFAVLIGMGTAGLAALTAVFVHGAEPTSVDELVQLLHARAISGGGLTLPPENATASWAVQNGVFTESGWASIYPPLHTVLLAGALLVGVPWLLGPLAIGLATAAFSLGLDRVLDDTRLSRASATLLAVCPFWLLLGSTYLSHSTAAAGVCLVFWAAARARTPSLRSFLLLGAAVGFTICVRPWTGLVLSAAIVSTVTVQPLWSRTTTRDRATAATSFVLGGVPFAGFLFWWNTSLFGAPTRLGYSAAFGPSHGLGFHTDPWGNVYGMLEAVAYSGADLIQLSAHLMESPLPALLVVGAALAAGARYRGMWTLIAWGGAGVLGNALYWHHGVHMGPRMLFETTPAWIAAAVCGGHALATSSPFRTRWVRNVSTWALVLTLVGSVVLAPGLILAQKRSQEDSPKLGAHALPSPRAVVFVHGSWASRVSSRLAASGMRRDSIETALRRNDICKVDTFSRTEITTRTTTEMDLDAQPGYPPNLAVRALSPGNVVRIEPSRPLTSACAREARSDRFGSIELESLLWRLPPLPGADVILARDMGPAGNVPVLELYEYTPYVYIDGPNGLRLLAYDVGMELAWGGPTLPTGGAK